MAAIKPTQVGGCCADVAHFQIPKVFVDVDRLNRQIRFVDPTILNKFRELLHLIKLHFYHSLIFNFEIF